MPTQPIQPLPFDDDLLSIASKRRNLLRQQTPSPFRHVPSVDLDAIENVDLTAGVEGENRIVKRT